MTDTTTQPGSKDAAARCFADSAIHPSALDAIKDAADAEEAFQKLRAWSRGENAQHVSADVVEDELLRGGMEIQRRLLEENFRMRGQGDVGKAVVVREPAEETKGGGSSMHKERLERKQVHKCQYESTFGTVHLNRLGYSAPGVDSIHPLDEELNLPHRRYSYPVQKRVALRASRGPFDEVVDEVRRTTAARVPKRQVEQIVEDAACDFELFYSKVRHQTARSFDGSLLVVGLDCKGVPRRRSREELAEPKNTRLKPGEKRTKKKMATVASVHNAEPHYRTVEDVVTNLMDPKSAANGDKEAKKRPRIENRRLWASVRKTKDEVFEEVREEMLLRDPNAEKKAVCVMDGERALKRRAIKYLQDVFPNLVIILDIMHVLDYLWDAGHALCGDDQEATRPWVRERLTGILQGDVSRVVSGIRQSATKQQLQDKKRETLDTACDYMLNNKDRMRYDEYLAAGLPIASGSVEGACGHLVKDRMEMTGALWNVGEERADAVLKLRALDKSGDFDDYWQFHIEQEKERLYDREWQAEAA